MKTITITIITLIILHAGFLFAGNEITSTTSTATVPVVAMVTMDPVKPAEATFEDIDFDSFNMRAPAAALPVEADFIENLPDSGFIINNPAFLVSTEAGFDDVTDPATFDCSPFLVTPVVAGFE